MYLPYKLPLIYEEGYISVLSPLGNQLHNHESESMKPNFDLKVQPCPLPSICQRCGDRIIQAVGNSPEDMTDLMHHCPENMTLIYTEHADIEGQRYINSWLLQSPCSTDRFMNLARQMAESTGSEMEFFKPGTMQ